MTGVHILAVSCQRALKGDIAVEKTSASARLLDE